MLLMQFCPGGAAGGGDEPYLAVQSGFANALIGSTSGLMERRVMANKW